MEEEITSFDTLADERELNEIKLANTYVVKSDVSKWRIRTTQLLKQFSRVRNLILKDQNSKIIHIVASVIRTKNQINSKIKFNNSILCDVD